MQPRRLNLPGSLAKPRSTSPDWRCGRFAPWPPDSDPSAAAVATPSDDGPAAACSTNRRNSGSSGRGRRCGISSNIAKYSAANPTTSRRRPRRADASLPASSTKAETVWASRTLWSGAAASRSNSLPRNDQRSGSAKSNARCRLPSLYRASRRASAGSATKPFRDQQLGHQSRLGSGRKRISWQRERIVGSCLAGLVPIRISTERGGGSSSVFSRAVGPLGVQDSRRRRSRRSSARPGRLHADVVAKPSSRRDVPGRR